MPAKKRSGRAMKLAPDIEHIDGLVLLTREESDHESGARQGKWYIAWHEIFTRKIDALASAGKNGWRAPLKAVRGSLSKAHDKSWYCEPCAVEVYERRCKHCGKLKHEAT